ncbi:hypothetical protein HBA55_21355 [Pseudomaricurvus alkylphenolicus]|uniref:hypothetical protein n=1 Tax=Pseudomaricurvus alkylphenolicus TaxID=1306991 RepID=UPI001422C957|nr:hypothetical protein [Pseudomaricurvus alkylphenolicus]NIB42168.1 hypothetical protein [Pseudomaricurvus alkylphenolicus]
MRTRDLIFLTPLLLSAQMTSASAEDVRDAKLREIVYERIQRQLNDEEASNVLTDFVFNDVMQWRADTINVQKADSIIAFAFGNRISENGNRLPGTMNEALAKLTIETFRRTAAPVYAQWEIAEIIGDQIPAHLLTPIYPKITETGDVIYLSTRGVAEDIARIAGSTDKLGKAIVISFSEHSLRSIRTAREVGIDAYAPEAVMLPNTYDEQSGQPWTRTKRNYVLHELRSRAEMRIKK